MSAATSTGAPIRIVIADDHRLLREGLRKLLEAEPGLVVVGEAEDGEAALELAKALKPDILLLDLAMPRLPGLDAFAACILGPGTCGSDIRCLSHVASECVPADVSVRLEAVAAR